MRLSRSQPRAHQGRSRLRVRFGLAAACLAAVMIAAAVYVPAGWPRAALAQDTLAPRGGAGQAASIPPPPRPEDPRAARAYAVFDTYCARCHQAGKLDKAVAGGGIANILALPDLAMDSRLVMPGIPDASLLYQVLAANHAPLDVFGTGVQMQGPEADDILAVRRWLRELPSRTQQCAGRDPITTAQVDGWVEEALRVEREGARDVRFISLVNLYNACMPTGQIAAARQAMSKLLNMLSWAPAPHALKAVDPNGTLLSFSLQDFGWAAGDWQTLQSAYPQALVVALSDRTRRLAGAQNPIVRGDWLAQAASAPKVYYQLLGIPQKLSELAKMNGIDIDYDVRVLRARRAIVRQSEVTRANRLVERHPGARGGFWLAYDFASSTDEQDLFERPLGPGTGPGVRTPFRPDLVRVMFTLPNGLLAYALYDVAGNRLDQAPPRLEQPIYAGAEAASLAAGGGCFSCHAGGIRIVRDAYRAHVASASPAPIAQAEAAPDPTPATPAAAPAPTDETVQTALQLAATDGELLLLSNSDNERYRNAMIAAGIDPQLTLEGDDVISALARRYLAGTDYEGAASELDLTPETFTAALSKAGGETALIARRLRHHRLPRAAIDKLFAYLKGVETHQDAAKTQPAQARGGKIDLEIWMDKSNPAPGELIVISAQADSDCYLTITNVDASGRATVIFPNDFEPDNLLSTGKPMRLPGADAPYQLRRKEDGRELIIAQCSTSAAPPMGIEHEFGRQRFTVLGDWENFIEDAVVTEADLRKNPEKAARARRARVEAMRRDRGAARGERADTAPGRMLLDGQSVIVLQ
ncbi:MAG TPA: DUF4384 domain-containing protein [Hyphomicrobium sp.]|nr:DUF4384 domain-containing protein [Hyphomicrobium sp.]